VTVQKTFLGLGMNIAMGLETKQTSIGWVRIS